MGYFEDVLGGIFTFAIIVWVIFYIITLLPDKKDTKHRKK